MGSLKVIIDGSLNTRTAYCFDAYPETASPGVLTVAPDELTELLRRARRAGLTAAVHAIVVVIPQIAFRMRHLPRSQHLMEKRPLLLDVLQRHIKRDPLRMLPRMTAS